MAEHQLDSADVDAVRQEAAGAFVTQVVRVQVDLSELLAIDACTWFRSFRVVPVREQEQKLQGRVKAVLEVS